MPPTAEAEDINRMDAWSDAPGVWFPHLSRILLLDSSSQDTEVSHLLMHTYACNVLQEWQSSIIVIVEVDKIARCISSKVGRH